MPSTLRLPAVFSEHMVLRAGHSNAIWGWAAPGAHVTVTFGADAKTAAADATGRWQLELAKIPAGGPYRLSVASGDELIELEDILAGEVWLCSGQSNMEWAVAHSNNSTAEIASANYPRIRLLQIPHLAARQPQTDVRAAWEVCTPKTVARFSAVGYFFGRDLHQKLNVPVGLINSSYGGTPAEAWTELSFLENEPAFDGFMSVYRDALASDAGQPGFNYASIASEWAAVERYQDPGNRAYFRGWADFGLDEKDWRDFTAPGHWREADNHHRGAAWFRKEVAVPKEWAGRDLVVSLGALHDFDTSYFNGVKIGGLGKQDLDAWMTPRFYKIPAALVRPGETNLIVTRVFVEFDLGGFTGGKTLALYPEGEAPETGIPLAGTWKFRAEYAFDATPPERARNLSGAQSYAAHLYNGMIAPLVPYGLSGVIWYQAESNASRGAQYGVLFPRLIESWRKAFYADLPFLFVLLANHQALQTAPVEEGWSAVRASQLEALKLPRTGVASAIDVGDAVDIHPRNKQSVGQRLALAARAIVYGEDIEHSGPVFRSAKRDGSGVHLLFAHTGAGLVTRDGDALRGFAVRADKDWHWADAVIADGGVTLTCTEAPVIREIRYAWASNPLANLSNKDGLPALPFRCDIA